MASKKKATLHLDFQPFLEEIASALIEYDAAGSEERFLYAEMRPGVLGLSVFCDLGRKGERSYFCGTESLEQAVKKLWKACQAGGEPWRVLMLLVGGTNFEVDVPYPDQVNEKESTMNRRAKVLAARFPRTKIVYPPMPDL
jgi:hypothetical protein